MYEVAVLNYNGKIRKDNNQKNKCYIMLSSEKTIVAIPCLNTGRTVGRVISGAKKYVNKVIVINDGSTDSTAEQAEASGAMVVNHVVTRGYGGAIRSCFEVARAENADIVVILDGDGQHDPDDIPAVLAPVQNGQADVVIGSRFLGGNTNMPGYRKFGIRVITFIFNFGSRGKVSDAQSGFRAYSKKIFERYHLSEKGMGVSIETLEKARRKGAVIKEVPVSCAYPASTLTLKTVSHGLNVAFSVVRIRLSNIFLTR